MRTCQVEMVSQLATEFNVRFKKISKGEKKMPNGGLYNDHDCLSLTEMAQQAEKEIKELNKEIEQNEKIIEKLKDENKALKKAFKAINKSN